MLLSMGIAPQRAIVGLGPVGETPSDKVAQFYPEQGFWAAEDNSAGPIRRTAILMAAAPRSFDRSRSSNPSSFKMTSSCARGMRFPREGARDSYLVGSDGGPGRFRFQQIQPNGFSGVKSKLGKPCRGCVTRSSTVRARRRGTCSRRAARTDT